MLKISHKECITKLIEEISGYKEQIKTLETKLEIYQTDHDCVHEIAKQPKMTNNTLNNNNKYMYLTPISL